LDFSPGSVFQEEVLRRFGKSVHHPSSSPFRLTESSVSFALTSCLGGSPASFHMQFLSDRHCCFSVLCKQVGFHVYSLRRFIGSSFDVYFHLWSNGSAHWEREKRLWELEQEKEWSLLIPSTRMLNSKLDPLLSLVLHLLFPCNGSLARSMANFQCNPQPYLPAGAHVEHGWQRPAQSRIALGGEPPRRHEDYAIVVMEPPPPEDAAMDSLRDVVDFLEHDYPVRVQSFFRNPLGLGLLQFQLATQCQILLDSSPIQFDANITIRVVKHDEATNLQACPYTRICRLMVLCFPLDYQTLDFYKAAVAPFCRLLAWHESPNKTKSFLDCLVLVPERVPHSFVVSQGSILGGSGCSWSAPVYIIGGHFPDGFPQEEDPVPADG
ncbi:hypothetical protein PVAP13_3KG376762, partial [Panicum virgatum]